MNMELINEFLDMMEVTTGREYLAEFLAKWEVFKIANEAVTKSTRFKRIDHKTGFTWGGYLILDTEIKKFKELKSDGTEYNISWWNWSDINQRWLDRGVWVMSDTDYSEK